MSKTQRDANQLMFSRNVVKNAKSHVQLSRLANCASKLHLTRKSHTFQNHFALVVVFAQRNVHLAPSTSSICQRISKPKSLIDILPIPSNFIDCLPHVLVKFSVWLAPTVLERVQLWRFWVVFSDPIWVDMKKFLTGKRFYDTSEAQNYRVSLHVVSGQNPVNFG